VRDGNPLQRPEIVPSGVSRPVNRQRHCATT